MQKASPSLPPAQSRLPLPTPVPRLWSLSPVLGSVSVAEITGAANVMVVDRMLGMEKVIVRSTERPKLVCKWNPRVAVKEYEPRAKQPVTERDSDVVLVHCISDTTPTLYEALLNLDAMQFPIQQTDAVYVSPGRGRGKQPRGRVHVFYVKMRTVAAARRCVPTTDPLSPQWDAVYCEATDSYLHILQMARSEYLSRNVKYGKECMLRVSYDAVSFVSGAVPRLSPRPRGGRGRGRHCGSPLTVESLPPLEESVTAAELSERSDSWQGGWVDECWEDEPSTTASECDPCATAPPRPASMTHEDLPPPLLFPDGGDWAAQMATAAALATHLHYHLNMLGIAHTFRDLLPEGLNVPEPPMQEMPLHSMFPHLPHLPPLPHERPMPPLASVAPQNTTDDTTTPQPQSTPPLPQLLEAPRVTPAPAQQRMMPLMAPWSRRTSKTDSTERDMRAVSCVAGSAGAASAEAEASATSQPAGPKAQGGAADAPPQDERDLFTKSLPAARVLHDLRPHPSCLQVFSLELPCVDEGGAKKWCATTPSSDADAASTASQESTASDGKEDTSGADTQAQGTQTDLTLQDLTRLGVA